MRQKGKSNLFVDCCNFKTVMTAETMDVIVAEAGTSTCVCAPCVINVSLCALMRHVCTDSVDVNLCRAACDYVLAQDCAVRCLCFDLTRERRRHGSPNKTNLTLDSGAVRRPDRRWWCDKPRVRGRGLEVCVPVGAHENNRIIWKAGRSFCFCWCLSTRMDDVSDDGDVDDEPSCSRWK